LPSQINARVTVWEASYPTATQNDALTHDTEFNRLFAEPTGLGTIVQLEPSHIKVRVCSPDGDATHPTAKQNDESTQLTPCR
jgi:hypothetical protein